MGLGPGTKADIVDTDGNAPLTVHIEMRGRVPVMVPDEEIPPLTPEVVRDTIEALRR